MVKKTSIVLFLILLIIVPYSDVSGDEKDALKALEKIKANVENRSSLNKYRESIAAAQEQINICKRDKNANPSFIEEIKRCLAYYNSAEISWASKVDMEKLGTPESLFVAKEFKQTMEDSWKNAAKSLYNAYSIINKKNTK
jgi:hypothetical protein